MRRTAATILLALACAAASAGCRMNRSESPDGRLGAAAGGTDPGGPGVDEVVRELGGLTEELAGRVERAEDPKAGVAEALRLLDARRGAMTERIARLRRGALARDPAARGRWLEAEVDGTQRVRDLQLKRLDAAMRDPELKAGLERLAADYDSMFRERQGGAPLE